MGVRVCDGHVEGASPLPHLKVSTQLYPEGEGGVGEIWGDSGKVYLAFRNPGTDPEAAIHQQSENPVLTSRQLFIRVPKAKPLDLPCQGKLGKHGNKKSVWTDMNTKKAATVVSGCCLCRYRIILLLPHRGLCKDEVPNRNQLVTSSHAHHL